MKTFAHPDRTPSAAANRRPAGQSDGSDNLLAIVAADRAFPAAVAELGRMAYDASMKKWRLIILLLCLLAAFGVWIVADAKGSRPAVHKVGMLKVGDSTNRVLEILGRPTEMATVRPGSAADIKGLPHMTWFYGGKLDWQKPFTGDFPFIAPFRVRLVSDPDPRDVVVQFDTNGQICKIHGP